jgi:uncharacterized protein YggT (Ycf19 family)
VLVSDLLLLIARLLDLLALVLIGDAILSWIPGLNPLNPFVRVIRGIATPVVTPFRGMMSTSAGSVDLSPVFAIVAVLAGAALFGSLATTIGAGDALAYTIIYLVEQLLLILLAIVVVLVLVRLLLALFQVDRWHPMSRAIKELSQPFCQPFEGIVSYTTTFDVAALVALVTYIVLFIAVDVIFGILILPLTVP